MQFVFTAPCLHLVDKVRMSFTFIVSVRSPARSPLMFSCHCLPQMVCFPKGSSRRTTRLLPPRTCVHPPRRDRRLHQARLPPRPNPTRTSAPLWRPPCCSSSPSRTPARPPRGAKTLPLWWRPLHSRLRPNPLLKPQQNWGLRLQHSSPKTRTCAFPTEPPADRQFGLLGRTCVQSDESSELTGP